MVTVASLAALRRVKAGGFVIFRRQHREKAEERNAEDAQVLGAQTG
jgi:hypothetical protein